LTTFTTLGAAERGRIRTEQLKKQRENEKLMREEYERKIQENLNKTLYEVDFEFTDMDRDSALKKMTEAATKVSNIYLLHAYIFSKICTLFSMMLLIQQL
jgi:translation initiation factor IF-2